MVVFNISRIFLLFFLFFIACLRYFTLWFSLTDCLLGEIGWLH